MHSDRVRRKGGAPSPGKSRGHDRPLSSEGARQPHATDGTRTSPTTVSRVTPAKKSAATRQSVSVSRFHFAQVLRLLPLLTALTISAFALAEIWETVEDLELGRAHGLLSMGVVKLAYAFGELQDKASEIDQTLTASKRDSSDGSNDGGYGGDRSKPGVAAAATTSSGAAEGGGESGVIEDHERAAATLPMSTCRPAPPKELRTTPAKGVAARLLAVLVGRRVTIAACVFALGACVVEIARDLEEAAGEETRGVAGEETRAVNGGGGGFTSSGHGAALLAASELVYQWHRLVPGPASGVASATTSSATNTSYQRRLQARLQARRFVSAGVALAAMAEAGREVVADVSAPVGAGHAMAILAAAQLVENGYRALTSLGVPTIHAARPMVV